VSRKRSARTKGGFRSGYEERIYNNAQGRRQELAYEPSDAILFYTKPAKRARYIPDFVLGNGVLVESKGRLTVTDRQKMLNVKESNPGVDIRFLFQRASNRITRSPNSMTYWQWAEKHGFRWYEGENIPDEWYDNE